MGLHEKNKTTKIAEPGDSDVGGTFQVPVLENRLVSANSSAIYEKKKLKKMKGG